VFAQGASKPAPLVYRIQSQVIRVRWRSLATIFGPAWLLRQRSLQWRPASWPLLARTPIGPNLEIADEKLSLKTAARVHRFRQRRALGRTADVGARCRGKLNVAMFPDRISAFAEISYLEGAVIAAIPTVYRLAGAGNKFRPPRGLRRIRPPAPQSPQSCLSVRGNQWLSPLGPRSERRQVMSCFGGVGADVIERIIPRRSESSRIASDQEATAALRH